MAPGSTVTRRCGALAAALLLVAGLAPSPARGEDDTDTEIAKRHFAAGSAAYGAGDYRRALREFEEARLARPMAAFDYNIARCLDRLERRDMECGSGRCNTLVDMCA